jgi:hypothetical protein
MLPIATPSKDESLAKAREALAEAILAQAPITARRQEADGYAVYVAFRDGSVLGFEYAEPKTTLAEMSLHEMAYLATCGEKLDAEARQELIDFGVDLALLPSEPAPRGPGAR